MKKLFFILIAFMVLFGTINAPLNAHAQSINLIPNASVESGTSDLKKPLNWQTESWGSNTATFSYKTGSAKDGTKSLHVKVASYSNGDAKWYFDPISVVPSKDYMFSDYYKSSVETEIVVRVFDQSGNSSYIYLGTIAKSTAWKKTNFQFTAPVNASKVTVLHLIAKNGYLQTDNYSLIDKGSPIITGNVPNNSLEQTDDGTSPLNWQAEKWGTNTSKFSYLNSGKTGSHSVKVQITKYTSGDAKWSYSPQPAIAGDYLFTDYYKSNVTTQVVVRLTKNDGTEEYVGLGSADPSSSWKKYSDIFTIPTGIKSFTVLHFISAVGFLITDDYSATAHTIGGFNRPIVSLTFDDGWEENYTSALPVLAQYGFKSTQFYATTFIESQTDQIYKIKAFADAGHEIGSHTITHPHLIPMSIAQIDSELSGSKSYLENIFGTGKINSFATPYGEYDTRVVGEINRYYSSHRSTDEGYNSKDNFNPYNIRVQNMTNTTTVAQFNEWVQKAKHDKTWLVIVYHRVGANPTQFESTPADFNAEMASLSQSGVTVMPIKDALSEIRSQM